MMDPLVKLQQKDTMPLHVLVCLQIEEYKTRKAVFERVLGYVTRVRRALCEPIEHDFVGQNGTFNAW